MRPGRASRWRSCARRRIRPNPRREPERAVGHGHHRVRDPGGQGVPAAGHRPLRRHARRLNVRAIVANDHSDNEVQQNVTAPSRYVAHLRIGNAVRDLNLVPHGISLSGWSKSHNRSLQTDWKRRWSVNFHTVSCSRRSSESRLTVLHCVAYASIQISNASARFASSSC